MTLHSQILRIARAGNPTRAMELFARRRLDRVDDDAQVLTLKGRLLKDQAKFSSDTSQRDLFAEASRAYLAAFSIDQSSYALINAATLARLAGDVSGSTDLAQRVLDMLDADPSEGETPYWREATRAEALLLLGDTAKANAALTDAIALQPRAHEDQAATIGQFERILSAQSEDAAWLEAHRPPGSFYFCGLMRFDEDAAGLSERVRAFLEETKPGYAFGALAAGADIVIAEAALAFGAELHIVLPDTVANFRSASVDPFGARWASRFDALIEQAARVEVVAHTTKEATAPLEGRVELAAVVAMGRCLRQADILRSEAKALAIVGMDEPDRPYIKHWRTSGKPLERIETPRISSGAASSPSPSPSGSHLLGVVRLNSTQPEQVIELAERSGMTPVLTGRDDLFVGPPVSALSLAKACLKAQPDCRISAALDTLVEDRDERIIHRAELIARADDHLANLSLDRNMALAALVLDEEFAIEEVGEISALSGPVPLWSGRVVERR